MLKLKKKPLKKQSQQPKSKGFYPLILSRHPSHSVFRRNIELKKACNRRSVVRFGSTTEVDDSIAKGGSRVEINTVEAIKNSANKLRMKTCFSNNAVKTADWWKTTDLPADLTTLPFPLIGKNVFGSRGMGNTFIENVEELQAWLKGKINANYIIEKYYNYVREYRLHVSKNGCFYTCRKMLKRDAPEDNKFQRHDDNCVWIVEENPLFDKPVNWENVVEESVKALKAVGLDFGAIDLRIQSAKTAKGKVRETPDFIIVEINSAPSMGEITERKYLEELPKLINTK